MTMMKCDVETLSELVREYFRAQNTAADWRKRVANGDKQELCEEAQNAVLRARRAIDLLIGLDQDQ